METTDSRRVTGINACMIGTLLTFVFACGSTAEVKASKQSHVLVLEQREGPVPDVPNRVPHQQLDQNSPPEILKDLSAFLFSLEHVEERSSGTSLPSARGAFIESGVAINNDINREFTHIHMEPGPGSQHLVLRRADAQIAIEKGWGVMHPWSDRLTGDDLDLLMIYAPRNDEDLVEIKKVINTAWTLALSSS